MKQPITGILATAIMIALSLAIVWQFDFATLTSWAAWLFMCATPTLVLICVTWRGNPAVVARLGQPLKGVVLLLLTVVAGALVAPATFFAVGGAFGPPGPVLVVFAILTVIVMFWLTIMFGGWPFVPLIRSQPGAGLLLLVACYGVSWLLFHTFFDFGFLRGAPLHVERIDPGGLFNANGALVFAVSATAGLFLPLHFDLWPLVTVRPLRRQPWLGLAWMVLALALGGAAMALGVAVMKMEPLVFMARAPIPFIFGTIIVLNMLQNSLFTGLGQPLGGLCNAVLAAVVGVALATLFGALAPMIAGRLASGAPGYDFERWLASALLGVTFPMLVLFAEFFGMWPLVGRGRAGGT